MGALSHELPDNVFEKGDVRPVKQTRKKIIKKKAVAATNGITVGRKRAADEVCIPIRISSFLLSFHNLGEESDMGAKKENGWLQRSNVGLGENGPVEDKASWVKIPVKKPKRMS